MISSVIFKVVQPAEPGEEALDFDLTTEAGGRFWIEDLKQAIRAGVIGTRGVFIPHVFLLATRDPDTGKFYDKAGTLDYLLSVPLEEAKGLFGWFREQAKLSDAIGYAFGGVGKGGKHIILHAEHYAIGVEEYRMHLTFTKLGAARLTPWEGGPVADAEPRHHILQDAQDIATRKALFERLKTLTKSITPEERWAVCFHAVDTMVKEGSIPSTDAYPFFLFLIETLRSSGLAVTEPQRRTDS